VTGKNVTVVNKFLQFLTYFIRCCEVKENPIRMEKQKDILNRQSGSNWSTDSMNLSSSLNNIHGWFERSCNVIPLSLPVDPFKDFKSYNHLDALHEHDESLTPRTNDRNIIERLKSMDIDTSKCYCVVLQALNQISDKSLRSYVNMDEKSKWGVTASKYCVLCRTIEKAMFEQFCDKCKLELEKSSIEVMETVCLPCTKRLEELKCQNIVDEKTNIKCTCNSKTECTCKRNENKNVCQKRPSFICYCCPSGSCIDLHLELKIDTSEDTSIDLDLTPRPRKASDPVDCIPSSPSLSSSVVTNTNFGNTRNSTNSHDSGTEMENSVGSCAGDSTDSCFTRTNSLSSQGIVTDLDSDYCSVDNEQLATMLIESSKPSSPQSTQTENIETNINHRTVSKSLSTTTLKSSLMFDLDTEDTEPLTDTLSMDLEDLRLKELDLPNTLQRSHRKISSK
jgi:hypothetical protein